MRDKRVVATWSGGIDSTSVIAKLLVRGWKVTAISLRFGGESFHRRELRARDALRPILARYGDLHTVEADADWLWAFSADGVEIPTRNKRIMDHLIARHAMPEGITNIAMGEYIGCDTWVVRDHVGASDCDARALTAYLYEQYGMDWRLLTLADFGESRYKSDRVAIGYSVLGDDIALTTNCLHDVEDHCGACYKCYERAAAFDVVGVKDTTVYRIDPRDLLHYSKYREQMAGQDVTTSYEAFA